MHSIRLNVPSVTLLGQLPTLTDIGLLRCTDAPQIRRRWVLSLSKSPAFLRFEIMMGNNDQRNRNWNPLGSLSNDDGNPKDNVVKMNWSISPRLIEIWQIHSVCCHCQCYPKFKLRRNQELQRKYTAKCRCRCGLLKIPNSHPNCRKVQRPPWRNVRGVYFHIYSIALF